MDASGPRNAPRASILDSLLTLLPGSQAKRSFLDDPPTEENVQSWLVARVAAALAVSPAEIDVRSPFASYGLDSRTAVRLSGELERWLERELSPTLIWDYPTIEAVVGFLVRGEDPPAATSAPAWVEP